MDKLIPETFALVREASKRVIGERHFDVQLLGGLALHHGNIAEMATGEGKTLSSTCPVFLNALTGNGVHIITPNDYAKFLHWMPGNENVIIYEKSQEKSDHQKRLRNQSIYGLKWVNREKF